MKFRLIRHGKKTSLRPPDPDPRLHHQPHRPAFRGCHARISGPFKGCQAPRFGGPTLTHLAADDLDRVLELGRTGTVTLSTGTGLQTDLGSSTGTGVFVGQT